MPLIHTDAHDWRNGTATEILSSVLRPTSPFSGGEL